MSTININVSKTDMGLDQVDNTSDLNKPISTATQTALDLKVDKVTGSRLITSAEGTILGNTSGTNTGDQTLQTVTNLGNDTTTNITSSSVSNRSTFSPSAVQSAGLTGGKLTSIHSDGKVQINTTGSSTGILKASNLAESITLEFPNKVSGTYTVATTSDFSGTNTGDETVTTIKTKLGVTTLSGSNTGDQDLTPYATKSTPTFTGLTTLDTLKVTTGNYITPVDVVGIDVTGNVNRISASNGRTALGLGTLATQSGTFSGTSSGTNTGDQTFLNARVQTVTSSATVTPVSTNDLVIITAQAVGLTLANPTGTFTEGQALMIRIKDNATAQTITFDTNYRAIGVTLPTTTVISKTLYLGIIYNSTDAKWDIIGYNIQA